MRKPSQCGGICSRVLDSGAPDPAHATVVQLHRRSVRHSILGFHLLELGDVDSAISHLRLALQLDQLKLKKAPHVNRYARDLADDTLRLGLALLHQGQFAEGERLLEEGVGRFAVMASGDPANALIQRSYFNSLDRAADHLFTVAQEKTLPKDQRRRFLRSAIRYWEQCRERTHATVSGESQAGIELAEGTPSAKGSQEKMDGSPAVSRPEDCGGEQPNAAHALLVRLGSGN